MASQYQYTSNHYRGRLNTAATLGFFDADSGLASPRVRIISPDGTSEVSIALVGSPFLANVYLSSEQYTPEMIGAHDLIVEQDLGAGYVVVLRTHLFVSLDPAADFTVSSSTPQTFVLGEDAIGDSGSTVLMHVLDTSGVLVETVSATWSASNQRYEATPAAPITSEDLLTLVWYDDGVFAQVQFLYGWVPRYQETVGILVVNSTGGNEVVLGDVTVLVSTLDAVPVRQGITNSEGVLDVELAPGRYVATLQKAGVVYTFNNLSFEVYDTQQPLSPTRNTTKIQTKTFAPTFTPAPARAPVCRLTLTLYDIQGCPLPNRNVHIDLEQGPQNFSGVGVFGSGITVQTDAHGYVEFDLVQGVTVTVSVMSNGYRRRITVPASAGPVDLLTLTASAPDVFDAVEADLPDVPRRS